MISARMRNVICLVVFLSLVVAPGVAAPESEEGENKPAKIRSPYVEAATRSKKTVPVKSYSNADLERMFGSSSVAAPSRPTDTASTAPDSAGPADSSATADPLKALFDKEKKREDHRAAISAATKRVVAAEQRISGLERRALTIRNPFFGARPAAPEEGAEEWEAADTAGRFDQNAATLESAKQDLARARDELAQLQRSAP